MPPRDRHDLNQYITYDRPHNASDESSNSLFNRMYETGKTLASDNIPLLVLGAAGLAAYAWSRTPVKPVAESAARATAAFGARSSSTAELNTLTVIQSTQQVEAHAAAHAASHHMSHDAAAVVSHDVGAFHSIISDIH